MNLSGYAAAAIIMVLPMLNCCSTHKAQTLVPHSIYSDSFVANIHSPRYKDAIRYNLDYFNNYASKTIVRYEGKGRPIVILDHHFTDAENKVFAKKGAMDREGMRVLGLAFSEAMYCDIFINDEIYDETTLKEVILHEYLHCYGFSHDESIPNDLMNAVKTGDVSEDNIKLYSDRLEKLIYGK